MTHDEGVQDPDESLSLPPTETAIGAALDTWEKLVEQLLQSGDDRGTAIATAALGGGSESEERLAVAAARRLLTQEPSTAWPLVSQHLATNERAKTLALGLADDHTHAPIVNGLEDRQLGDLYRWLADLFPPEDDRVLEGAHFVGPEEQAREWRESCLRVLARRGSGESVRVLAELSREFPERLSIAGNLVNARAAVHADAWSPPTPEELAELFADGSRRLVRSNGELLELIGDVLGLIEAEVPNHGELLWDRIPKKAATDEDTDGEPREGSEDGREPVALSDKWQPKPEAALCAYLAHELVLRLMGRGVAVNREILVRPTNAYGAGDRTDITVEAPLTHDPFEPQGGPPQGRVAIVVEVKGMWNGDVRSAQRDQLAARYLPEARTDHGAYVVGSYPLALWTEDKDHRRRDGARRNDDGDLASLLNEQAQAIRSDLDVHTVPFIIQVPRPHHRDEVVPSAGG